MNTEVTKRKWLIDVRDSTIEEHPGHISIIDQQGNNICLVSIGKSFEYVKNTQMIAKAPELLHTLKEIVNNSVYFMGSDGEPSETFYQAINEAEKLIKEINT